MRQLDSITFILEDIGINELGNVFRGARTTEKAMSRDRDK
jgi:hypothetical protein